MEYTFRQIDYHPEESEFTLEPQTKMQRIIAKMRADPQFMPPKSWPETMVIFCFKITDGLGLLGLGFCRCADLR